MLPARIVVVLMTVGRRKKDREGERERERERAVEAATGSALKIVALMSGEGVDVASKYATFFLGVCVWGVAAKKVFGFCSDTGRDRSAVFFYFSGLSLKLKTKCFDSLE